MVSIKKVVSAAIEGRSEPVEGSTLATDARPGISDADVDAIIAAAPKADPNDVLTALEDAFRQPGISAGARQRLAKLDQEVRENVRHWNVPQMGMLRPPFLRFDVAMNPVPAAFADAATYSTEIKLNGLPVRVDGWQPRERPTARSSTSDGVDFQFGLQIRPYMGTDQTVGELTVTVQFWDADGRLLGTSEVQAMGIPYGQNHQSLGQNPEGLTLNGEHVRSRQGR